MPRSMLPNRNYRDIEKKHGVRGKYVLGRVLPWIGRGLVIGGLGLMIYGGEISKRDIEKGSKYLGIGTLTAFFSAYALYNRRELESMREEFRLDKENDERIRQEIIKNQSDLEKTLSE